MRVGQRILAAVSSLLLMEGRELRTSVSVGIALSTLAHARAEELLQEADVAMRRAKALGGPSLAPAARKSIITHQSSPRANA
jgi:GGDEF domain-containing protein